MGGGTVTGGRGRRARRRASRPIAEINLTSLLDVAFVLLIAFMMVAPSLQNGVDLRLPAVAASGSMSGQSADPLKISLPPPGSVPGPILLSGKAVTPEQLEAALVEARQRDPKVSVILEADRDVPYQKFAEAVAAVRRAGIVSVGLPLAPPAPVDSARP